MKSVLTRLLPHLPFITFAVLATHLFATWIFVRFVHYDSQYRTLPIDSYSIEVIDVDDYAKLQDPSREEIKLSNGTTISDRQPAWFGTILPNYKRVGEHYVHVTTLGTAHYYSRWIIDTLPLATMVAFGLVCSYLDLRRRSASK